jgi:hypothetical protein
MTTTNSSPSMEFLKVLEAAVIDPGNKNIYDKCLNDQSSPACQYTSLLIEELTLGGVPVTPPPNEIAIYIALMLVSEKELAENPKFRLQLDIKPQYITNSSEKNEQLANRNFILPLGPFGSKKDHILRLSCENEYFSKFSEEQKNWVANKLVKDRLALFESYMSKAAAEEALNKNKPDWEKMGVCTRVNWLYYYAEDSGFPQNYKNKGPRFPQANLIAALRLINFTDIGTKKSSM